MNSKFAEKRIGQIKENKYGSVMKIVKYNNSEDIWVEFIKNGSLVHTAWWCFREGEVKNPYDKTVYSVGYLGEGKYKTRENGLPTPQYEIWSQMICRCYKEEYHKNKFPTYKDCTVVEEWHNFQNFAAWYDENFYKIDGERMTLDKDILDKNNKVYSPETCIFVPQRINGLFVKKDSKRGEFPIGVSFHKASGKFIATCNDSDGNYKYLRLHTTPEEAFRTYKEFKENVIKQIAKKFKEKIPEKLYQAMVNYSVEIYD